MSYNKFLLAVTLLMAFQMNSNGVSSEKNGNCPVKFPEGFFCNFVCQSWGLLSGNTVMCFVSDGGEYHRFIARNPSFGVWRFYRVDTVSDVETLCKRSVSGDEFFLNGTDITCGQPQPPQPVKQRMGYHRRGSHRLDGSKFESGVPMDAICELATTQICRQNKIINCVDEGDCCYAKTSPDVCSENSLIDLGTCHHILNTVLQSVLLQ